MKHLKAFEVSECSESKIRSVNEPAGFSHLVTYEMPWDVIRVLIPSEHKPNTLVVQCAKKRYYEILKLCFTSSS